MSSGPRLQVLAAALLFSTGGAAIKATALSGVQVACLRSAIAALALALAMPAWRRVGAPRYFLVGAAYAATLTLYVLANKLTTAANTIFLQSTAPMYLLLLGPWLLRERIRAGDLLFTGAVAGGMTLFFVGAEPPQRTAPEPMLGNLLGACCGLTWAFTILGLRWLGRAGGSGADEAGRAVIAGNLLVALATLPWALPLGGVGLGDGLVVGYLGVIQIGLAYVFMTRGVREVRALEASLLLLLEPVLSTVWAWLSHGERPGPWSLLGCSLIFVATVVKTLYGQARTR